MYMRQGGGLFFSLFGENAHKVMGDFSVIAENSGAWGMKLFLFTARDARSKARKLPQI